MVLHINETDRGMTLISLPRDLFYKGKKINDTYRSFGPGQLTHDISDIMGLNIEKYVVIDMYAFAEVIDILGGIDITLAEDLIDPTYRVKDNGKWSTLYYPAGMYHLGGIEALRVARSRHYSSDFGRTERQQQLLDAVFEKIRSLDIGDTGKIYSLVHTLLKYVDTNFSAFELVELFLRNRNSDFTGKVVLNTGNVLYHTYSNLYYLDKKLEDVDDSFFKGSWILLPLENDWNIIRWYARSFIEGGSNGRSGSQKAAG